MKDFKVILNEGEVKIISANTAEDARQAARKMHGVYKASVLNRINKPAHPHSKKGYASKDAARKEAFTSKRK